MPLSEFLRMARGKLDSSQQKTDASSRPENDLVELVWENGQIVMQGQSSRGTRNSLHTNITKATPSRFGKFESIMNDMAPEVVPSGGLDLSQEDEMVPWLSYPIDDSLGQDYVSDLLPEISGVTGNGVSARSSFLSGVSDIASNKPCNNRDGTLGNRAQGRDVVSESLDMKVERQNVKPPTNSGSNFLNFSHFSRAANLVKANADGNPASGSSCVGRVDIREKSVINPVKSTLERFNSLPEDVEFHGSSAGLPKVNSNTPKGASPPERTENLCLETSAKNDNSTKGVPDGERIVEPMVASSSVGSGNSADRVSCEQTHNSKRKFHDIDESDYRSDEVDTESLDAKKTNHVRGSKRGRAAEVHNLSERRRRDRINEKMRALQELIPNCNKADKASMLDEAIEYLKTLQLQVQIMSMGAGLCMPPMMFPPPGMHPAHFPPMGVGMGMATGFGMGMMDMNGVSAGYPMYPVPAMHVPHFRPPVSGIPNFRPPVFGQGFQNSVPRPPSVPLTGAAMGMNALRNGSSSEVANKSSVCNAEASCSMNDNSNQATTEVLAQSASVQQNKYDTDVMGHTALTSIATTTDISKEPGERDKSPLGLHVRATGGVNSGLA